MSFTGAFLAHTIARDTGKSAFFFSPFTFERMRENGNTHFCFYCGGWMGFTPDAKGKATNWITKADKADKKCKPVDRHDPVTHADGTLGNADKYSNPRDWLRAEMPKGFRFIVNITD